jgi:serine/threonine protein kinase
LTEVTAFAQQPAPEAPARNTTPLPLRQRHTDLPTGTLVGAHYQVEGKLGEGAMGAVYAAIHLGLGKRVAIKVIAPKLCVDPSAIERFEQEARTVAQLAHPAIVDVSNIGVLSDGRSYFVMEWLHGEDLRARLDRGPLTLHEALDILAQIAEALDAAHRRGVIHRDLKPENTFLVNLGRGRPMVKLLDFGLAKLAGSDDVRVAKTSSGQLLGTPYYMSPEQCRGRGVDHRTDIYALGCMAYELVCGTVPFDADNAAELIAMHLHTEPPRPSALRSPIPRDLDALLRSMIDKDADRRPTVADAEKVIYAVRRAFTDQVWSEAAPRRRGLIAGLAAGIVVALIAIVAVATSSDEQSYDERDTPDALLVPDAAVPAYPDAGAVAVPDAQPDAAPRSVRVRPRPRTKTKPRKPPVTKPKPRNPRDETVDPFRRRSP